MYFACDYLDADCSHYCLLFRGVGPDDKSALHFRVLKLVSFQKLKVRSEVAIKCSDSTTCHNGVQRVTRLTIDQEHSLFRYEVSKTHISMGRH